MHVAVDVSSFILVVFRTARSCTDYMLRHQVQPTRDAAKNSATAKDSLTLVVWKKRENEWWQTRRSTLHNDGGSLLLFVPSVVRMGGSRSSLLIRGLAGLSKGSRRALGLDHALCFAPWAIPP